MFTKLLIILEGEPSEGATSVLEPSFNVVAIKLLVFPVDELPTLLVPLFTSEVVLPNRTSSYISEIDLTVACQS